MNALERLSSWAAEVPRDHGRLAYDRAAAAVTDTLACILAGAGDPAARGVRQAIADWGDGPATVVGSAQKVAAPWAALANGTAGHALDFDDYDDLSQAHSSVVLVPALLALGEERRASGADLLDAYIVGLEVMMRIGQAINLSHYNSGWHATATIGTLGAAVACARLQGLGPQALAASLSLATSMAAGFKTQFGTQAKPLHAGLAAKSGLVAAGLAASGLTASSETLDGEWSVLTRLAGSDAPGFAAALSDLGRPLGIEHPGLVVKRFPCCGCIHKCLDGLLELREAHGLRAGQVKSVVATIPGRNTEILRFPRPATAAEARFSMEYCLAAALLGGKLTLADFSAAAVGRPEVRALLPRIRMDGTPVTAASNDLSAQEPERVTIELTSGDHLTTATEVVRGSAAKPLTAAELEQKFRSCAGALLPPMELEQMAERLAVFAGLEDLGELLRPLARAFDGAELAMDRRRRIG